VESGEKEPACETQLNGRLVCLATATLKSKVRTKEQLQARMIEFDSIRQLFSLLIFVLLLFFLFLLIGVVLSRRTRKEGEFTQKESAKERGGPEGGGGEKETKNSGIWR
jgi:hypothetical protein